MSLLVIPVSKSDYLVGIVLVISLVIAGIVAPAGIEALESSADYLIAFKPLFIYAYLDKYVLPASYVSTSSSGAPVT